MQTSTTFIPNYYAYLTVQKGFSRETAKNRCYELEKFIQFVGAQSFNEVNFTEYLKTRNLQTTLCSGTVDNIRKTLFSFYEFLEVEQIINENIAIYIDRPRKEYKLPNYFNAYELFCIVEQYRKGTVADLRVAAMCETLYSTGMRVAELTSCKVSDYKSGNHVVTGKGNKQRHVIFNKACKKYIDNYLKKRKIFSDYLFCNERGGRLSSRYVQMAIKDICNAAGITFKASPHTFRHTYAMHLLEGGANIREIQDLLGHAMINTTLIYAKTDVRHLRKELQQHHPRW